VFGTGKTIFEIEQFITSRFEYVKIKQPKTKYYPSNTWRQPCLNDDKAYSDWYCTISRLHYLRCISQTKLQEWWAKHMCVSSSNLLCHQLLTADTPPITQTTDTHIFHTSFFGTNLCALELPNTSKWRHMFKRPVITFTRTHQETSCQHQRQNTISRPLNLVWWFH